MSESRRAARRGARVRPLLLPLLAAWLAGGCGGSDGPSEPAVQPARGRDVVRLAACDGPALGLPAALAAALPGPKDPASPTATIDDRMAALARRVPGGFAGVFFDGGRPVLLLTAPSEAAAARAALAPELAGFPVADAEVRPARWDYAQLYDWYQFLRGRGLNVFDADVNSTDLDEAANRLHFGVRDAAARDRLAARLTALGLPCDLVLVSVEAIVSL